MGFWFWAREAHEEKCEKFSKAFARIPKYRLRMEKQEDLFDAIPLQLAMQLGAVGAQAPGHLADVAFGELKKFQQQMMLEPFQALAQGELVLGFSFGQIPPGLFVAHCRLRVDCRGWRECKAGMACFTHSTVMAGSSFMIAKRSINASHKPSCA